jgi:3-deoxy-manno-octulosonate cytidylyltransferase (CMP-KDO synthetase)
LLKSTGKYLIQHVYERACQARQASQVIIATDDPRIVAAVQSFGGQVVMTRRDHANGTERVAEVAQRLDVDVIINLQGDEPLVDPLTLDLLPDLLAKDSWADVATVAVPIHCLEQWRNPNCVKVVCDDRGRALYFSRSPIPFVRDGQPDLERRPPAFLQHLGLYAYRKEFLLQLAETRVQQIEELEKLEQLRVLAIGRHIAVGIASAAAIGVDTYEDYIEFVADYRNETREKAA